MIQTLQNKILRRICGAHRYQRNKDSHRDLDMEPVGDLITKISSRYEARLHRHTNEEAIALLDNSKEFRRLKRRKPWELATPRFDLYF